MITVGKPRETLAPEFSRERDTPRIKLIADLNNPTVDDLIIPKDWGPFRQLSISHGDHYAIVVEPENFRPILVSVARPMPPGTYRCPCKLTRYYPTGGVVGGIGIGLRDDEQAPAVRRPPMIGLARALAFANGVDTTVALLPICPGRAVKRITLVGDPAVASIFYVAGRYFRSFAAASAWERVFPAAGTITLAAGAAVTVIVNDPVDQLAVVGQGTGAAATASADLCWED
jgi:hypothetical protein